MKRLVIAFLLLFSLSVGYSQQFEVGFHYDHRGYAGFGYVTDDFKITYLDRIDTGIWLSPSVEVTTNLQYIDFWGQLQFLVDTPYATLSVRTKYEYLDQRGRYEFRVGILLGE